MRSISACSRWASTARSLGPLAVFEDLDLLQVLERLGERRLGGVELVLEVVGRPAQIVAADHGGAGIGRIGEVARCR